ncbi:MAG: hypothetical protein OEX23_10175 [Betaproteobacteria bacterium]|nr:hypothetical protein [Betaproteobacteria bacterium]
MNEVREAAAAATADAATVDRQHPWLGLASFTEETRSYFHGREEEVGELARRVQRKLLTILFGQSGLGKTSILRAGLVPKLRPEGYCPVYVRIDYSPESPPPSEQIKQAIFRETKSSGTWTQTGVAVEGESLWEFLHHRDDVLKDADGRTLVPLVIFDQFEEVFTIAQGDAFGRDRAHQFLADLADLVENRPPKALEAKLDEDDTAVERFDFARADYRILIALREDYLAHLEGLKGMMPSITQNRMRLARMTGTQALAAVTRPGGRLVTEEVAEAIVRFVAGGAELRNAEVEPALLSLVCRELNNARIAQGSAEISADVLAGSRDTILGEFYERALADQPERVRQVIEDHLLTDSGYRESLAEERLQKLLNEAGAAPGTMGKLVDRRLLRVEERLDVRRVELTHDVLTGVVKASRDLRLEREAREEAEAKLAAQREREQATRRALVRARQIAAGCAVLAVVAIGSAVYGYFATERAKAAEAKSEETRLMAEQARGEAEKLVVYLLDDFQLELAPVGRLDIVAELAKRAIDYYNGLPAPLRTPQSERNRALALVRYGSVLRTQARMDEGSKAVDEAVKILSDLREQGDRSEPTTIGLAMGLAAQARLVQGGGGGNDKAALALAERAAEVIRSAAGAPNSSVALRRTLGEVLTGQGFILDRLRDPRTFTVLDEAREAFRSIDGLAMTDLPSAAGYAESTVWKVQALMNAGRADEAAELGKESLAVSRRIIEKRPGHMQALRAQAVSTSTLARAHLDRLQPSEALKMSDATVAAWEEFLRLDASNIISLSNLGVARFGRSNALLELGRVGEAAATLREMTRRYESATPSLFLNDQISFANTRLANVEASRGNARAAEEAMRRGDAARDWQVKNSPAGSWRAQSRPLYNPFTQALVAGQLGDDRRVLELGRDLAPKLAALTATDQGSTLEKANTRRSLSVLMALAAYRLGDYAAAERATAVALEQWSVLRPDEQGERRDEASDRALRALVLVRLGRQDEARALAGPVLALQRGLASKNQGSAGQRFELAQALIAAAASGIGDARAQRAEAARLIDGLPEEFRDTSDVKFWRARLAEVAARP